MDQHKFHSIDWYPETVSNVCATFWARTGGFYFFGFRGFLATKLCPGGALYTDLIERLTALPGRGPELAVALQEFAGHLPVRIWAAAENEFYGPENVLVRIEAADRRFIFLPDLLAPVLIRAIWYPSTVASKAALYAEALREALLKTSDEGPGFERYMVYGFGQRSASSAESAVLGGAAVLQFFEFTDIVGAREWLREAYSGRGPAQSLKLFSLDHGRYLLLQDSIAAGPREFLRSVFDHFDIFSIPADSTSLEQFAPTLRALVHAVPEGGNLILRWDGSRTEDAVPRLIEILKAGGEPRPNGKGYLAWKSNLYLMFTEDMSLARMRAVLDHVTSLGYAVDRLLFGTGTQMIQNVSRDDFGVVGKITAALKDGRWTDVEKTSADQPAKRGLSGRLSLEGARGGWRNERTETTGAFKLVYDAGPL